MGVSATDFTAALTRLLPEQVELPPLALAVSGGPDSLAMLLLASEAGLDATVLTVDHGLRPEAASEAAYVAEVCGARAIPHHVFKVAVERSGHGVQAAARAARYAAMGEWCAAAGIGFLLTAHHADDQAETLLMRLSRGSGLSGMAGIRARRPLGNGPVELLRPLLAVRKLDLVGIVEAAGLRIIDDPSNDEPAYDRTMARRLLLSGGIDSARAAETAHHLADAEAALAWTADEAWAGRAEADGNAVLLDIEGLPAELVRRLVIRAILSINPAAEPEGPAIERFIVQLRRGERGNVAGVAAEPGRRWRFSAEPVRSASIRHNSAE